MAQHKKNIALGGVVLIALTLASCGSGEVRLKGERVSAVLETPKERTLSQSSEPITLPPMQVNTRWIQTGGAASHVMGHLAFGKSLEPLFSEYFDDLGEGPLVAPPIVGNGRLYLLDSRARVHALDSQTGERLWTHTLTKRRPASFGGGMALLDNRLFITTGVGLIVALRGDTGDVLWRATPGSPFRTAPVVRDDTLLAMGHDNKSFALDAKTGRPLWNHQGTPNPVGILTAATPALQGNTVVIPYSGGETYALRIENGSRSWRASLTLGEGGEISSSSLPSLASPVAPRGRVILTGNVGHTIAINIRNGQRIWLQNISSLEMPWVAGDYVFLVSEDAILHCAKMETGELLWSAPLPKNSGSSQEIWRGPILAGGRLYLASSKGYLAAVNPINGALIDNVKLAGGFSTAPILAERTLFLISRDQRILAFR